jgi:transcriptional regulator with XRE-family HTH domain
MAVDTEDLAKRIGRAIAQARQQRGLTQEQVAERLGVEQETISRFERGAVLPPLARLAELAETLAVPMADFVRTGSTQLPDQAQEVAYHLDGLLPADRELVRRWMGELCARFKRQV